jgi:hypothetical protein
MRDILEQIENGLDSNQYYLSLFVSLTIPAICGSLESNDGRDSRKKYEAWFDEYVAPKYNGFLDGHSCYCFRCSLLHQGSTQYSPEYENQEPSKFTRILFIEPKTTKNIFHNNIINDALNIDVKIFCQDIISGAKEWLIKKEQTENFKKNYPKLVKRYVNGLSPFISGVPVIS